LSAPDDHREEKRPNENQPVVPDHHPIRCFYVVSLVKADKRKEMFRGLRVDKKAKNLSGFCMFLEQLLIFYDRLPLLNKNPSTEKISGYFIVVESKERKTLFR